MQGQYLYELREKYPHMGPEDTLVWSRFIAAHPSRYDSVDYDIAVGTVPAFVTRGEAEVGGNLSKLYRRKIDVVGFVAGLIDVIEVKPRADFSTIGQVLGYFMHWQTEHGGVANVRAVIVCGEAPLDVRVMAESHGVEIFVV